jgi:regulator of RNase E activity RraB
VLVDDSSVCKVLNLTENIGVTYAGMGTYCKRKKQNTKTNANNRLVAIDFVTPFFVLRARTATLTSDH